MGLRSLKGVFGIYLELKIQFHKRKNNLKWKLLHLIRIRQSRIHDYIIIAVRVKNNEKKKKLKSGILRNLISTRL